MLPWEGRRLCSHSCLLSAHLSQHPVVRNALFCLDTAWKSAKEGAHGSNVYTKALLAYAFALAGNQALRIEILKSLSEESVKEGESGSEIFLLPTFWAPKNSRKIVPTLHLVTSVLSATCCLSSSYLRIPYDFFLIYDFKNEITHQKIRSIREQKELEAQLWRLTPKKLFV